MYITFFDLSCNVCIAGLRSYPARLSYCKIHNLDIETRMNNFTISTFDEYQNHIENEPVSIEFGMDPVRMLIRLFSIL